MSDAPTSEPPAAFQAAFEEHLKREQEIVGMRYDDAPSVTDRGRTPGPLRHDPMEGKAFDASNVDSDHFAEGTCTAVNASPPFSPRAKRVDGSHHM